MSEAIRSRHRKFKLRVYIRDTLLKLRMGSLDFLSWTSPKAEFSSVLAGVPAKGRSSVGSALLRGGEESARSGFQSSGKYVVSGKAQRSTRK